MKTIIHWSIWLMAICLLSWVVVKPAKADPIASAEAGGVRIVVYTDKCALHEVKNLTNRAVWNENGKQIEGCV